MTEANAHDTRFDLSCCPGPGALFLLTQNLIQLTQPAAKRCLRGIFSSYANTLSLNMIHSVRATNFVSVCACICHKSNKLTFSPIYCKHTNSSGTHISDELRRRASVSQIYLLCLAHQFCHCTKYVPFP